MKTAASPVVRPLAVTALLLLLPLIAMQVSGETGWTPFDFALAGTLVFVAGLMYELVSRHAGNGWTRLAAALGAGSALFLAVASAGVGLIGADGDPANLMYLAVLAVGVAGALIARFEAGRMATVMFAMAGVQTAIGVVAVAFGLGQPYSPPAEILGLTALFAGLFVAAGMLFRRGARGAASAG